MTLEELKASTSDFVRPVDIAPILGVDAQRIRTQAQEAPEKLGFNVCVIGTRVKIPRRAFLAWLG